MQNVKRDRIPILIGYITVAMFAIGLQIAAIVYGGLYFGIFVYILSLSSLVYMMIPEDVDDEDLEGSDAECKT